MTKRNERHVSNPFIAKPRDQDVTASHGTSMPEVCRKPDGNAGRKASPSDPIATRSEILREVARRASAPFAATGSGRVDALIPERRFQPGPEGRIAFRLLQRFPDSRIAQPPGESCQDLELLVVLGLR
jgi:hypothetical protein